MNVYWFNFQAALSEFVMQNLTWFIVVFAFIILDIVSKLIVVFIYHDFSSKEFRSGLGHKFGYFIVLCAVAIIQVAMFDTAFELAVDVPVFSVVCGFIILLEFSSILENACYLNPKLDGFIGKYFAQSNPYPEIYENDVMYSADIDYTIKEE